MTSVIRTRRGVGDGRRLYSERQQRAARSKGRLAHGRKGRKRDFTCFACSTATPCSICAACSFTYRTCLLFDIQTNHKKFTMASSLNIPRKTFEPRIASLREKKPLACGGNGRCQRALIVTASCSEQQHRAREARGDVLGNRHRGRLAREVGLNE